MKKYIAIIDDSQQNLTYLKKFLQTLGCVVFTFKDPKEAIQIIPTLDVDIVLTDYIMFSMTGLEVISELRKTLPDIEYILWTSFKDCNIQEYCKENYIIFLDKIIVAGTLKDALGIV